jgi:aspartyl/asparaginyl-tRNA synthetase
MAIKQDPLGIQTFERIRKEDKLMGEIEARNIPMKDMNWYLDTRKYGSCPHAGFYKSL